MTIRAQTFAPGGASRCQDAIARATLSAPLTIERDPDADGGFVVIDSAGEPVGYITAKHWLSRELANGRVVLELSVNCARTGREPPFGLTVRVAIGDEGDEMPPMAPPSSYHVNVVGESKCQRAIADCMSGDPVTLAREIGNPYDKKAIVVISESDERIGYIGRDSWLKDALLEEEKGCSATIELIHPTPGGLAVVLHVALTGPPISDRLWRQ